MLKVSSVTSKRLDIEKEGSLITFSFKGEDNQNVYIVPTDSVEMVYIENYQRGDKDIMDITVAVSIGNEVRNLIFEVSDISEKEINELVKFLKPFIA